MSATYSVRTVDPSGSVRYLYPVNEREGWKAYRDRCAQIGLGRLVRVELRKREGFNTEIVASKGEVAA